MKKILMVLLLVLFLGCDSSSKTGNRVITLYDANGKVLQIWDGDVTNAQTHGAAFYFKHKGKRVVISGTYVVEEK